MGKIEDVIKKADNIDGWMSIYELQWLAERAFKSKTIIEVGAYKGRSTVIFGNLAELTYSIDNWEYNPEGSNTYKEFQKNLNIEILATRVIPLKMDSIQAVEWLKKYHIKADMVFIDGNHEHPIVDQDILLYKQFVRRGGVFCGHDAHYSIPHVLEALDNNLNGWKLAGCGTIWEYKI